MATAQARIRIEKSSSHDQFAAPKVGIEKSEFHQWDLIQRLLVDLHNANVRYCHWKSNTDIQLTLQGENDLDLLIHRADVDLFQQVIMSNGFKETLEPGSVKIPGIYSFYGFDPVANRFVHVHAHYQLVVGHDATKNYRIPVEEEYLKSARLVNGIFLPSVEYEFILFVIRMVLKHMTPGAYFRHEHFLSNREAVELKDLLARVRMDQCAELISSDLPFITFDIFGACAERLHQRRFSFKDFRVGLTLEKELSGFRRMSPINDVVRKTLFRAGRILSSRIFHTKERKQFRTGGLMIAFVGGDGAGKTTLITSLYEWLSGEFVVRQFHFGKPPWSLRTSIIRALIKIKRMITFQPFLKAPIVYSKDPQQNTFPGIDWAIREVCTARDRYILFQKARRLSTNGRLVLIDRYPVDGFTFMESPQIRRMYAGKPNNRLMSWLIKREESYYRQITPADLMIVLKVNPEVAVRRKSDEEAESVRARSREVWDYEWKNSRVKLVDASLPKEIVCEQVKDILWSSL